LNAGGKKNFGFQASTLIDGTSSGISQNDYQREPRQRASRDRGPKIYGQSTAESIGAGSYERSEDRSGIASQNTQ
jgi:hypothetical protein